MNSNKKRIAALFFSILILFSLGYFLLNPIKIDKDQTNICDFKSGGPITIHQLAKCSFEDGDIVNIKGKISEVNTWNSTYGSYYIYNLEGDKYYPEYDPPAYDDYKPLFYILDKEKHNVGDDFEKTLHLKEIKWDGVKMFSADELCLHLLLSNTIKGSIETTSYVAGVGLKQESAYENSTIKYNVYTNNGEGYPLEWLNIYLIEFKNQIYDLTYVNDTILDRILDNNVPVYSDSLKLETDSQKRTYSKQFAGIVPFMASAYIFLSGILAFDFDEALKQNSEYLNVTDQMISFDDGFSDKGLIEFVDSNSNNRLDDFDVFYVNVTPTTNISIFESYFFVIQGAGIFASEFIIDWYNGPFLIYNDSFSERGQMFVNDFPLAINYSTSEKNETLINTKIRVSRNDSIGLFPYNQYNFEIDIFDQHYEFDVSENITNISNNVAVEFTDANNNSILDKKDYFLISGLKNKTNVEFRISYNELSDYYRFSNKIKWVAGYGEIIGSLPYIRLEDGYLVNDTFNRYRINLTVDYWHPELSLNLTPKISLLNNSGLILKNMTLTDGIIGLYDNKTINFVDKDNDFYLSNGDYILIEYKSDSRFEIELSILFGEIEESISIYT